MLPGDRVIERLTRCVGGLALFGLGIAVFVRSELGLGPWDVFHEGLADRLDLSIGSVIVGVGLVLLPLVLLLRVRIGLGTALNTLEIGLTADLWLRLIPDIDVPAARRLLVAGGLLAIGVGSGLYIGAGLGTGPRDGIMVGLAARGVSISRARTGIELTVLIVGLLLGGTAGIGTLAFALGIGPMVQLGLTHLAMSEGAAPPQGAPTAG